MISKYCRCGNFRRKSGRECLICHAANMREWRKTHPMTSEQKRKDSARSMARVYYRRGKIKLKPCWFCQTGKNLERHHPNYDFPLKIVWLCKLHHRQYGDFPFPKSAYA